MSDESFRIHRLSFIVFSKLAYKPHFVGNDADATAGDHLSGSVVTNTLLQPTRMSDGTSRPVGRSLSSCLVLLPAGFACPTTLLPPPVVSYTTVSPSPAVKQAIRLSVALSGESPRPAVSRRRALWSADFPRPAIHTKYEQFVQSTNHQPRSPGQLGRRS